MKDFLKKRRNRVMVVSGYLVALALYLAFGFCPSALSENYPISGNLSIPEIALNSDVTALNLENHILPTPETIVGSFSNHANKTLLIGHASTIFEDLDELNLASEVIYNNKPYYVSEITTLAKSEINMSQILSSASEDTLILMTCAGTLLENGDASHRLIITAKPAPTLAGPDGLNTTFTSLSSRAIM